MSAVDPRQHRLSCRVSNLKHFMELGARPRCSVYRCSEPSRHVTVTFQVPKIVIGSGCRVGLDSRHLPFIRVAQLAGRVFDDEALSQFLDSPGRLALLLIIGLIAVNVHSEQLCGARQ